jgi:hypothetical protein
MGKLRARERLWLLLNGKCEFGRVIERRKRRSGLRLKTDKLSCDGGPEW